MAFWPDKPRVDSHKYSTSLFQQYSHLQFSLLTNSERYRLHYRHIFVATFSLAFQRKLWKKIHQQQLRLNCIHRSVGVWVSFSKRGWRIWKYMEITLKVRDDIVPLILAAGLTKKHKLQTFANLIRPTKFSFVSVSTNQRLRREKNILYLTRKYFVYL